MSLLRSLPKFGGALAALLCVLLLGTLFVRSLPSGPWQGNFRFDQGGVGGIAVRKVALGSVSGPVDLWVLGSSHAYRGFDPRVFAASKISLFNLGSSAQTPLQSLYLYDQYLRPQHPTRVVVVVSPRLLGQDGVESALQLFAAEPFSFPLVEAAVSLNHLRVWGALISSLSYPLIGYPSAGNTSRTDTWIAGGYVESSRTGPPDLSQVTAGPWTARPKQADALRLLLRRLNDDHVSAILVQCPLPLKVYRAVSNEPEVEAFLTSLGVPYVNLNKEATFPDAMFYDANHLTQAGAQEMDTLLIGLLRNKNFLPSESAQQP